MLTINSYKLLKEKADENLKTYLGNEIKDFKDFKKWIINEVIDPYNTKLPGDIILDYYNYTTKLIK